MLTTVTSSPDIARIAFLPEDDSCASCMTVQPFFLLIQVNFNIF